MIVYETMTLYKFPKYQVRVWRDCTPERPSDCGLDFQMGPDPMVEAACRGIEKLGLQGVPRAIADTLWSLPRISAVEVLDPDGNGGLIYPNWP